MGLITARLNHKTLINIAGTLISHRARVNRLPSVFGSILSRHHTVDDIWILSLVMRSISLLTSLILPSLTLLINKSHRKLPDINRMIWIILILVDDVQVCVLHGLLLLLFIDV